MTLRGLKVPLSVHGTFILKLEKNIQVDSTEESYRERSR